MSNVKVSFVGFDEFGKLLKEMQSDFNEADQKKILTNAVRKAMQPVLSQARALAPVDTGALRASLRVEARKPSRKDKKSIYVKTNDVVIATVTTAPSNVLAKKQFLNLKTGKKQKGIPSDARAIANEFGTAKHGAKPYMRPALESQTGIVLDDLAGSLRLALLKYKSRK
jgi:HK97 gp10 family phage protein